VHGDKRVQAGSPASVYDDVLVIEGFEVAVVGRRGSRARAHCVGVGVSPVALPVDGPAPVVVPAADPVPVEVPVGAD
jgi:hypothetical protein